ncbi:PSP1 domain-containing protein [Geomesophilobacter sediminis]|uniref:Stage 0 sporulation family protein n=1 Tax=Geomesophilobacter sediminis TaxID=2798584 RepID=A0A8J7M434_9BACT|nr:stage 0 sporulation family protein [Geomesophilobacter sediminis]MBJ6727713.1 stage 0 sporulation family protein [Geomesophilobacter sediminis]
MARIVRIQFGAAGKLYDFTMGKVVSMQRGDKVIVETERGKSIGQVVAGPLEVDDAVLPEGIKPVLRIAEPHDLAAAAANAAREKEAHRFCLTRIKERGMEMKLVKVEYLFDGSKAIFYFTADGRVDFRELVKDLAHAFHTRIEMRQIGVRDESKMVGGIGICGRELCCSSYLREFEPVSVKMAKEQNLALNPSKISGQCGRLLCCLSYEFETYCSLRKGLPKCGKRVQCCGIDGEIVKVNVLQGTVTVKTTDDSMVHLKGDDIPPESVSDRVKKPPQNQKQEQQGDAKKGPNPGKQRRDRDRERRPQDVKERKKEKPS